ncbi:MAG TPA: glycine cleavage system protein GcvH [Desulfosporosinus sp.]|nr:glycine cleavage system protein GcvH [Desulfosporosinus sp.]
MQDKFSLPSDVYYYKEHTWVKMVEDSVKVGISDFAQDNLGDIIFVELPEVGASFSQGEVFGQAESAKSISSLFMPISGEVIGVNNELEDSPEGVNQDPYGEGWMILVRPTDLNQINELLSNSDYLKMIKES